MTAPVCCGARDYRPATKPRSRKRSHPRQRAARGKTKTSPPPETPPRKEKREDKNSVKAHPLAARVIWLKHLSWPPRPSIQRGVAPSPARPTRPSSRGLGRRPFTAKTGVRIPLGAPFAYKTANPFPNLFLSDDSLLQARPGAVDADDIVIHLNALND